ncbi:MAG: glycosyltransferase [Ktedonobacterales bacterium]|nr:glycosyltransferase [Ktedonobacterales bacterium]
MPRDAHGLNGQGAGRPTTARRTRAPAPRQPRPKKAPTGKLDVSGLLTSASSSADTADAERATKRLMETVGAIEAPAPLAPEDAENATRPHEAVPTPEPAPAGHAPRRGGISPENTVFVSLCFEGPDIYSTAGGLGTRVAEFTETLAHLGYETHLIFVGDPNKPAEEVLANGKLHLKRWSQWISHYYPNGVYDGEEHKLYDYNESVPYHVYNEIARPAIEQGKIVVIIGEDWHTAEAISRTSDLLHWHNLRHRCILMWNCNSLMSLHRINWGRLNFTSTITTVSRYMKHKLWEQGVNPLVIPNGIPSRYLEGVDEAAVRAVREAALRGDPERLFLFKIGRFDPDKRWLMAVEAAARLKYSGHAAAMVIRGGIEPHGGEVVSRARHLGLRVKDIEAQRPTVAECVTLLRDAGEADIYNLRFFVPEEFVRLCYAGADAVLANSGHEPFGLVGLEVMAAGGIAFTGSTGEDYALSFENAVALETEDPEEIVGYLLHLTQHPDEREKIRTAGRETAAEFTWEEAIDNLSGKLGYLARKQSIVFE